MDWPRLELELDRLLDLEHDARELALAELEGRDPALAAEVARLLIAAEAPSLIDRELGVAAPELVAATVAAASGELEVGARLGAWEVLEEIGAGGMGRVYSARRVDGVFERRVALKVLARGVDGLEAELRFRREQQILAGLEHEGLARLYDAGLTADGRAWIAMELLEGTSLLEHCEHHRVGARARVELVERVCRAVAHAHRRGIVHRDLKPSNILVVEGEDGEPRPVVLDFGIARDLGAPGATRTGQQLGTPGYMAPEQAAGEVEIDRRADVFALGVILYELLTGRRPFAAPTPTEELRRLLDGEPERPRSLVRGLDRDLEAIVLACLDRDPDQRYPSALALSEDLARFLAGEPSSRRPVGAAGRLVRRARRHPVVAALATSLVLLGLAAGWWSWYLAERGEERTRVAQRFAGEAARLEAAMRIAHLAPLHDLSPRRATYRGDLDALAREVEGLGRLGEEAGRLALGRGYLALGDPLAALGHLEVAHQLGSGGVDKVVALAEALAELHRSERLEAGRISAAELRRAELERIDRERRDRALELLGPYLESEAVPRLLEARVAIWSGRLDEASRLAEAARTDEPWLYEAWVLEGDLAAEQARAARGDRGLQDAYLETAERAYGRATEIGSSDSRSWEAACRLAGYRIELAYYERGDDPEGWLREVDRRCGNALASEPDRVSTLITRSRAQARWAETQMRRGEDPAVALALARRDAEAALALDPVAVAGLRSLADALVAGADASLERGEPDREALGQAIALLERATDIDPRDPGAWNSLGLAWWSRAEELRQAGADLVPALDAGIVAFGRAIELRADYSHALSNRGALLRQRMEAEVARGEDPRASYDLARTSLERALEANPANSYALNNLGNVFRELGQWQLAAGEDPRNELTQALALFERAAAANPGWSTPLINAGTTHTGLALAAIRLADGDPGSHFDRAEQALAAADEIRADFLHGLLAFAEALLERASWDRERGQPQHLSKARARSLLERSRAIAPGDSRLLALEERLGE